ncbi:MAG: glutamine-hydrolyzing carbamoyl-phosphate synthase small subunit [Cohaesibacteraceae bacterium]|nr:glutamine-hydrolyzing carbamoyl-phosphate synthase small subunit [Cohaesibacteraceae bacterium]MBL4875985.1 glutamine-hydrolyzing carbamoyl-phosphate synthase small subunit [Cohaesibacteraceae bacterium]
MGQTPGWNLQKTTARLVLADGTIIEGTGIGATGSVAGEVCFNTAITGYQEILTDPSYAGQIVTFTFPHIGNVGTNEDDLETIDPASTSGVRGCVLKIDITDPANYRASRHLDAWLKARGIIGITGLDTRALTSVIRTNGMPNAVIAHMPDGEFDPGSLKQEAASWSGLEGTDLAKEVTTKKSFSWDETTWVWNKGFGKKDEMPFHVVAIDFGIKRNILRLLADQGCKVTVLPASATSDEVKALNPDGIFLSNGPGDPAATGKYAVPAIKGMLELDIPVFGICLGHQILSLALGAKTKKMHQGHHGANHPVRDHTTGKVEITSMNHGFTVDRETLPSDVEETHVSLFDDSNCGIRLKSKPVFSVQYHPEASPGPQDSHYLFKRFVNMMRDAKGIETVPERL